MATPEEQHEANVSVLLALVIAGAVIIALSIVRWLGEPEPTQVLPDQREHSLLTEPSA